jgi:uncharacterized pyridoxal phosphate-containing UPF0001 family protein
LRELRDQLEATIEIASAASQPRNDEGHVLDLSMGMSQDFEVAVQEGATMVRIGTAIFGENK